MAIEYNRRIASRAPGSLSQWWERVVAYLRGPDEKRRDDRDPEATAEFGLEAILAASAEPQFPVVARGYDRASVERAIAELQMELAEADRELAEVRNRLDGAEDVQTELRRLGEQTSAVLIAAYDQRDVILREAREQAQAAVTEAEAKAGAMVADGETRLREIEARTAAVQRERDRLLDEIRSVSASLATVAESVDSSPVAVP